MSNNSLKDRVNTILGAYEYSCPDISAAGRAYSDWSNGRPITTCTRVGYRYGITPIGGNKHSDMRDLAKNK